MFNTYLISFWMWFRKIVQTEMVTTTPHLACVASRNRITVNTR